MKTVQEMIDKLMAQDMSDIKEQVSSGSRSGVLIQKLYEYLGFDHPDHPTPYWSTLDFKDDALSETIEMAILKIRMAFELVEECNLSYEFRQHRHLLLNRLENDGALHKKIVSAYYGRPQETSASTELQAAKKRIAELESKCLEYSDELRDANSKQREAVDCLRQANSNIVELEAKLKEYEDRLLEYEATFQHISERATKRKVMG